jgi:hypothetical protein
MVGRRVQRGFRRFGIVLAAPFVLASATSVAVYIASEPVPTAAESAPTKTPADLSKLTDAELLEILCLPKLPPGFVLDRASLSKSAPSQCKFKQADAARDPTPLYWAAGLSLSGVALFALSLALGWVLAGFARDDDMTVEPPR